MYQSANAQLLNAKKESANKRVISSDIDQMVRNRLLEQGIQPMIVESESPIISVEKNNIMEVLKHITTQPTKFYKYLFDTNQIQIFSIGFEEFIRKYLKYRKNLSADLLINTWERYKSDSTAKIENLEEIEKSYNRRNKIYNFMEPKRRIQYIENVNRHDIINDEELGRMDMELKRLDDYEKIPKMTTKQQKPPPPPPPKPLKQSTPIAPKNTQQEFLNELKKTVEKRRLNEINSRIAILKNLYDVASPTQNTNILVKEMQELWEEKANIERKMRGSGLSKKGQKKTTSIMLVIDPTKMARKAVYPVNRTWSYM